MPWTFDEAREGYGNMWRSATLKGGPDAANANNFANKIIAAEDRYKRVQAETGVPWFFIGALHMRESSCNFAGVLHNGEHIIGTGRKTSLVPAGRGPFASWEEAAVDALKLKRLHQVTSWPVERMLYHAEEFNGWGYANKRVNSPYVWAGTNHEQSGKYVADHVWDASAQDSQLGVAAVLIKLAELRPDIADAISSRSEVIPPVAGLPPDLEDRLIALLQNIDARLRRLEQAAPGLPALPAPQAPEPAPQPTAPPATTKPGISSDFITSILAGVVGVIAQKNGNVGMPIGEGSTMAGLLTNIIPLVSAGISLYTGSNLTTNLLGGLLNGVARLAPATRK